MKFTPAVQASWHAILDDPSKATLVDRVNSLLDVLETDPDDPRVRRRRFTDPDLWCFTARDSTDDLVVLWNLDQDGDAVVVHIGPSTFA